MEEERERSSVQIQRIADQLCRLPKCQAGIKEMFEGWTSRNDVRHCSNCHAIESLHSSSACPACHKWVCDNCIHDFLDMAHHRQTGQRRVYSRCITCPVTLGDIRFTYCQVCLTAFHHNRQFPVGCNELACTTNRGSCERLTYLDDDPNQQYSSERS